MRGCLILMNKKRCSWVNLNNEIYVDYHDNEWGKPVHDDKNMYEMFLLETFQAGLSWITILKKREYFRLAFDNFDVNKIAKYDEKKISELMNNKDIIRNRLKITAAINNAKIVLDIKRQFGSFCNYLWGFVNNEPVVYQDDIHRTTDKYSDEISKDLKKRGMNFVGSVTIYSFLQAVGIVFDHDLDCFVKSTGEKYNVSN